MINSSSERQFDLTKTVWWQIGLFWPQLGVSLFSWLWLSGQFLWQSTQHPGQLHFWQCLFIIFFWNSFIHWNRKMRMQALRPCWDDIGLKPWICTLCKGRKVSPKCDQMWGSKSAKVEYRGIPLCHGLINGDRNLGLGASVASLCHPYLSYIDHVFANNVVYYISLSALSSVTIP